MVIFSVPGNTLLQSSLIASWMVNDIHSASISLSHIVSHSVPFKENWYLTTAHNKSSAVYIFCPAFFYRKCCNLSVLEIKTGSSGTLYAKKKIEFSQSCTCAVCSKWFYMSVCAFIFFLLQTNCSYHISLSYSWFISNDRNKCALLIIIPTNYIHLYKNTKSSWGRERYWFTQNALLWKKQ